MLRIAAAVAALLAWTLSTAACSDVTLDPEYVACRCTAETCGPTDCSFDLRLDGACSDQVPLAEILIDGHLEDSSLEPGDRITPCSRTAPGTTSEIIVRGGQWIWGPLERTCPAEGGETHTLIFECRELANP